MDWEKNKDRMKKKQGDKSLIEQYGNVIDKIAPHGFEIVGVASANIVLIILIIIGGAQTPFLHWGVLVVVFLEILIASFVFLTRRDHKISK